MAKKLFQLCFLILVMTLATEGFARDIDSDCDQTWLQIDGNKDLSRPEDKARAMEGHSSACIGTVTFQVRLVNYYLQAGKLDHAEEIIKAGLLKRPNSTELNERLSEVAFLGGDFIRAETIASKLIRDEPTFAAPYLTLSSVAAQKHDWRAVVRYQSKAYELTHSALLLLPLVSALHQLDQHEDAVATAYLAIKEDPKLVSRSAGIDEAIYSLASLGRFDEAKRLIRQRMVADPNWNRDATLVQAAKRLKVID